MRMKMEQPVFLRAVRRGWRQLTVRKNYKDQLFVRLFRDKKSLLELYNALNGTTHQDPEELTITTIDDVLYLGYKNDCSFIIGNYLNLYEHQSTFNPNMPIRGLIYLVGAFESYIKQHDLNLYGSRQIKLPTPRYIVFYNGIEDYPDRSLLHLSDAFEEKDSCIEFTAVMLNINKGRNEALMRHCRTLHDYAWFIDKVREYLGRGMEIADAVDAACSDCIENDILKEYLLKHRSEVKRMLLLTEYNPKKQRELDRRDAKEEGQDRVNRLNRKLIELNRQEDIIRAAMEPEYQEKLFREFEI